EVLRLLQPLYGRGEGAVRRREGVAHRCVLLVLPPEPSAARRRDQEDEHGDADESQTAAWPLLVVLIVHVVVLVQVPQRGQRGGCGGGRVRLSRGRGGLVRRGCIGRGCG